jgi:hypothetical protein
MMNTQTSDNQILLSGSDDSNSYQSDDSLFDEFDLVADPNAFGSDDFFENEQLEQKPSLEVFLKPAKSRDDQYEAGPFPCSLLCNPYKYDIKVVGEIEGEKPLSLDMVDSDSLQVMQMPSTAGNHNMKAVQSANALTIESVTKISKRERIIRFSFNLCSFHVQRKSFCLVVKSGEYPLYVSSAFRTYARRRDHHNYNRPSTTAQSTIKSEPPMIRPMMSSGDAQLAMVPPMQMFMCQPAYPQVPHQRTSPEIFSNLGAQERTSLAIQLMTSLSPMERQAVNYYLSCGAVVNPNGYPSPYPTMTPQVPIVPNTVLVGGISNNHHLSLPMRYHKSR